jgi:hypothetical protein
MEQENNKITDYVYKLGDNVRLVNCPNKGINGEECIINDIDLNNYHPYNVIHIGDKITFFTRVRAENLELIKKDNKVSEDIPMQLNATEQTQQSQEVQQLDLSNASELDNIEQILGIIKGEKFNLKEVGDNPYLYNGYCIFNKYGSPISHSMICGLINHPEQVEKKSHTGKD